MCRCTLLIKQLIYLRGQLCEYPWNYYKAELSYILFITGCSTLSQTFRGRPVIEDVPDGSKTAEQVLDVDAAESIKQALTVAYQKTEKSDLVRQLGWQICQSFLNNAISEADYLRLLETMVLASLVNTTDKKGSNILDLKA